MYLGRWKLFIRTSSYFSINFILYITLQGTYPTFHFKDLVSGLSHAHARMLEYKQILLPERTTKRRQEVVKNNTEKNTYKKGYVFQCLCQFKSKSPPMCLVEEVCQDCTPYPISERMIGYHQKGTMKPNRGSSMKMSAVTESCINPFEELYRKQLDIPEGRTLYLSRHGESEYNVDDRIGGDPDITERGQKYARALGAYFMSAGKTPSIYLDDLQPKAVSKMYFFF